MEVITENPIIYIGANDTYDADIFLALDGTSTYSEIRAFQEWSNSMYNTKLTPDGKWGKNTKSAFSKYGKEWEAEMGGNSSNLKISPPISERGIVPPKTTNPSPAQIKEAKKKGLNWDSVNKVFVKAQELGIVDAILGKLGITPRTNTPPVGVDAPLDPMGSPSAESKGMSTTTKVLIGVGVVAVVGFILYSSKKK